MCPLLNDRSYAVAPQSRSCLPFVKLRKFGSKVLDLFFINDFRLARRKSLIKGRKSTTLPKAETTFGR